MNIERTAPGSLIDVLDRVLEKGIVIDAWIQLSVAGVDLVTVEARVVVACIQTYLKYTDDIRRVGLVSPPELAHAPVPWQARPGKAINPDSLQERFRRAMASR